MIVQELNTLLTICELERNQLLTILAISVQNQQLAGFLLTGNRSNFLYVEGSTAWLYDCPHFLSPLYKADRCFDRIPIHYKDTLMYVDPITRQSQQQSYRSSITTEFTKHFKHLRSINHTFVLQFTNFSVLLNKQAIK